MRESLAISLYSSNLLQKESDCALDKVHAIGLAAIESSIGIDALRFIDAMQPKAHNDLIYALSRKAGKKMKCDKSILLRLCKQVLHESMFKFCNTCVGAKEMRIGTKIFKCEVCNGSGLHRHTDQQRAKAIGLSVELYNKHWASKLLEVQSIYSGEYKNALRIVQNKLDPT